MGIEKSILREENKVKYPFPKAYFVISSIRQENGKFSITVRGYGDKEASVDRKNSTTGPEMPGMTTDPFVVEKKFSFSESMLPAPEKSVPAKDVVKHCCYVWLHQNDFSTGTAVFEDGQ